MVVHQRLLGGLPCFAATSPKRERWVLVVVGDGCFYGHIIPFSMGWSSGFGARRAAESPFCWPSPKTAAKTYLHVYININKRAAVLAEWVLRNGVPQRS